MARLTAIANRHSRWRELTEPETSAAVAELREVAGGRGDLLAEVASIVLSAREGELDEPKAKAAVELCRLAGADEALIPQWAEEGSAGPRRGACPRSASRTATGPDAHSPS